MSDICVIYASENKLVVEKLVLFLRRDWEVWWDGDFPQGDWEQEVRNQINNTKAVVAVFSSYTKNKTIFRDELTLANEEGKLIYPFFIEKAVPTLGFGSLTRTYALGWDGDENHPGLEELRQKIIAKIGVSFQKDNTVVRKFTLDINGKSFKLPGFIFSLSSHETQVPPRDGVDLLKSLNPSAGLISAYDVWQYIHNENKDEVEKKRFLESVNELRQSSSILVLDSGNYEAFRKNDRYSEDNNKEGWRKEKYREIAAMISPDIAFSYDEPEPEGEIDDIANQIIGNYYQDKGAIGIEDIILCPIVHLPKSVIQASEKDTKDLADWASQLMVKVASELKPIMIAIPERELGCGLMERVKTVRRIREALNSLGRYYPLHLLGTGNPITMIALAAAGADAFDGLEWCRTVADYDNGFLFHFQHFDFFKDLYSSRLHTPLIRTLIDDPKVPYITQVIIYNLDFFTDWTKTMQELIEVGKVEHLLKNIKIPNVGNKIFKELLSK